MSDMSSRHQYLSAILRLCALTLFITAVITPARAAVNSRTYPVQSRPEGLASGDFNNDGRRDLAVVNRDSASVSILLGDGAGGFGAATNFPTQREFGFIVTGDFNNDGRTDLILSGGGVSVLLGTGTGSFGAPTNILMEINDLSPVVVGDFNRDGNSDLVATSGRILLSNGAGGFTFMPINTGGQDGYFRAGDFNHDGLRDLVLVNSNTRATTITALLGVGDGSFSAPRSFQSNVLNISTVTVGDFNGDGSDDLVVGVQGSTFGRKVSLLLADGTGGFGAPSDYRTGWDPTALTTGDFDHDGRRDLAVRGIAQTPGGRNTYGYGTISLMRGDGAGHFAAPHTYGDVELASLGDIGPGSRALVADDFNGDGRDDVSVVTLAANTVSVWLSPHFSVLPALSINDLSFNEGDDSNSGPLASFTATLSAPSTEPVLVSYAITNGTTDAGDGLYTDPVFLREPLYIPAGSLTATFQVGVSRDRTVEPDETFFVNLLYPINAVIGDGQGVGTILNDDVNPNSFIQLSAAAYLVREGDGQATITVTRGGSGSGGAAVTVTTTNATGVAGEDYTAVSQVVTFAGGDTNAKIVSVPILNDLRVENSETINVTLGAIRGAVLGTPGTAVLTVTDDDTSIQFSQSTYQVEEGSGYATLNVTRLGNLSGTATVDLRTADDPAAVPCSTANGTAYARCDYATTIDTLTFAPGESGKEIRIPIIDDAHVEGNESVQVTLGNVAGAATLNPQASSTMLIIADNDRAGAANPVFNTSFFVRQQYLDFLSREPEANEPWSGVLNNCSDVNNNPACDRITVSQSFFGSPEFRLKGFYVFNFYRAAFGRRPTYAEIVADMRSVTGQTPAETFNRRAAFPVAFAGRQEFRTAYDAFSNQQYVDALLNRYQLQSITTPDPANPEGGAQRMTLARADLVSRLAATGPTGLTRAQVLRAVVESNEVAAAEYNGAFVAMQYYGYLRRAPEEDGYNAWVRVINQDPNNVRVMVNGFVNSAEYRLRFGQP